jgi:hypothetical protein
VLSKPILVALFALLVGTLVLLQVPYINGAPFWPWPWRTLPRVETFVALAVGSIPFLVGQWIYARFRATWTALVFVMLGCFTLKLASVLPYTDPPSLELVRVIVEDRGATSYYTDAAALNGTHASVREWLELYHEYMPALSLHSKTKAPGPILYYTAMIKLFGVGRTAAMVGGIVIGLVATFSIAAAFLLIRALTRDAVAAFHAASFMALCPGFVLFFPMMDPTYPILSCALVGFWAIALHRDDWRWALALGAALAVTCIITFNVLVIGMFMAAYPLVVLLDRPMRQRALLMIRHGAIAAVVWLALLGLARLAIGYDALGTFQSAWKNQHELLERYAHTRLYPQTIPFDLSDFALGSGWVSALLVIFYFAGRARQPDEEPRWRVRLGILCIAQLVAVAVSGLLQLETARVWNFMLPLLVIPIGLELRDWSARARAMAYASLWFVMYTIAQNVKFIY